MKKEKVIIIFGGKSGEHEVSVNSALSIEKNIDRVLFETSVIGIAHDGSWNYSQEIKTLVSEGKVTSGNKLKLPKTEVVEKLMEADIIFPIIHGTNGEDGTIQGLLELANVPYVGSGVLGSAVCMDKVMQKQLCATAGISQTNYLYFTNKEWQDRNNEIIKILEKELSYPVFVKPANLGSSVGISKVKERGEINDAVMAALLFDNKVIIEEGVENILEVEIAILGNENPQASVCGSIVPNTEFYDYDTKYITDDIKSEIPARIPEKISQQISDMAINAYQVLNCSGLARIDFFYQEKSGQVFLNEINTLPGFVSISMYPKLWQASGLEYSALISELLQLAKQRWNTKQSLKYTY